MTFQFTDGSKIDLNGMNLQIVVVDCPYDTIQSSDTQLLLGRIAELKISGYQSEYPPGILPVDTTDFVSTHLLLCEKSSSGPKPIMGMKSITQERAKFFNLTFPVLNLLKGSDLPLHQQSIETILKSAELNNEQVAYNGSWTIHPRIKDNKELKNICVNISVFFLIQYYIEYGIKHILAGATHRFKVERYKKFIGYEYLAHEGTSLPAFNCIPFFGENVSIMYLHQFRQEAIEWAKGYLPIWEQRLTIAKEKKAPVKQVA